MIAHIKGVLTEKSPTLIVLEVSGMGFQILVPLSTSEKLPEIGENVHLLTYMHVREDALVLFGFFSVEERDLFKMLLSVTGIGPKLALTILSGDQTLSIYQNIAEGNESALIKIKGLGKKTAQQLVLDLKEKAAKFVENQGVTSESAIVQNAAVDQALLALMSLGYNKKEAENALNKACKRLDENASVEDLIKESLNS